MRTNFQHKKQSIPPNLTKLAFKTILGGDDEQKLHPNEAVFDKFKGIVISTSKEA